MNPRKPCAGRSENRGLATGTLILATALFASSCLAQQSTSFDDSQFVAEIPAVGTLALKLRKEYQGKRSATMLWLFNEISGTWELQDGRILFYRLFRDREHSIYAILEYPQLSREVLDVVGNCLLNGEAGSCFPRKRDARTSSGNANVWDCWRSSQISSRMRHQSRRFPFFGRAITRIG